MTSTLFQRPTYACLNGAPSVHFLAGCTASCMFCYLRGHDDAPPPSEAEPIENAIERITQALATLPRSAPPVKHVVVDPGVDLFPTNPRAQDTAYRLLRSLFERKIGVSFFTKGTLTRRFIDLFSVNQGRVRARVALTTMDPKLAAELEPHAAAPNDRLDTIAALSSLDALADVRVDPLLPGLNDTDVAIGELLGNLHELRVPRVVVSYVHLRPAMRAPLLRLVPAENRRLIEDAYVKQPWVASGAPTEVKLLPRTYREEGYLRFRQLAEPLGIPVSVCQCKNLDISGDSCGLADQKLTTMGARPSVLPASRPTLFPC
ncbi:MAG: radical SAM protein [Deltaproteobacteria bacterium]|nr:radical SAM protein [Deltaproteobacteria bacterium]